MLGALLGIVGGLLQGGLALWWFRRINQVRVPTDSRPAFIANAVALVLGLAALALGAGTLGSVFAAVAILGGAAFIALAAQSGQARKTPAAALGGPIIEFVLPDHEGKPFDLAALRGTPFLLKFFRGHW